MSEIYKDWRHAVLARAGLPISPENVNFLTAQQQNEGGDGPQRFNWLNTTMPYGQTPAINSHGVRAYPDYETGVNMTANTLMGRRYQALRDAMRQNNPMAGVDSLSQWAPFDPNYVNKIRASYAKLGSAGNPVTPEAMGLPDGGASDAFSAYAQELQRLQAQANQQQAAASQQMQQYGGQMDQLANQAPPENDPKQAFITSLMGNLSQAISPRMGGQQQAQGILENDLQGKRSQRQTQYSQLSMKYMQAARMAERSGDMERSAKLQQLALKHQSEEAKTQGKEDELAQKDKRYKYEAFGKMATSRLEQELASIKQARELNRTKKDGNITVKDQKTEDKLDRREKRARREYEHATTMGFGRLSDKNATDFDIPDLLTTQANQWRDLIKSGKTKGLREAVALAEQENGFNEGELWDAIKDIAPAEPAAPAQRDDYGLPGLARKVGEEVPLGLHNFFTGIGGWLTGNRTTPIMPGTPEAAKIFGGGNLDSSNPSVDPSVYDAFKAHSAAPKWSMPSVPKTSTPRPRNTLFEPIQPYNAVGSPASDAGLDGWESVTGEHSTPFHLGNPFGIASPMPSSNSAVGGMPDMDLLRAIQMRLNMLMAAPPWLNTYQPAPADTSGAANMRRRYGP